MMGKGLFEFSMNKKKEHQASLIQWIDLLQSIPGN